MSAVTDAATEYAALNAIGAGITEAQRAAAEKVVRFTQENGITKGTLDTPLGPVTLRENKATTSLVVTDPDALLGWCEINLPSAIIRPAPIVNEQSRRQLLEERFVRVGDQVVDSQSGEVLPFVSVKHTAATAPTVSYGASETQREVKAAAALVVKARAAQLSGYVLEAHTMAKAIEEAFPE